VLRDREFVLEERFEEVTAVNFDLFEPMFFGGVQLLTIGIIGEYIARIYTELQDRPQFLIREKVNID
jgi:hypothetical protein